GTNESTPDSTRTTITANSTLSETTYTWYINCTSKITVQSETRTLTIDTTPPSIEFVPPTPENNNITTNNWAYINVSTSDSSNTTAFIDWNRSLVLWMRFNNESGENSTFFRDWSTYGNNGTGYDYNSSNSDGNTPPRLVYGKFGKALEFDGVDDYVDCGNNIKNYTLPITIETWIYKVVGGGYNNGEGHDGIVSTDVSSNYYGTHLQLSEKSGNSYKISIGYGDGTSSASSGRRSKTSLDYVIEENKWYHIVGIIRGSTNMSIYVNGIEVNGSYSGSGGDLTWSSTGICEIGNSWGGWNYRFKGIIDEVRIWNRALSPEEINASYHTGLYRLYHNFTNLTDGTYTYKAYVQDLAGNLNETEERTITIGNVKYIDSCQNLTAPNTIYKLTTNVSSSGTCFNILADNITLDCQNYWINYSQSQTGYAMNNSLGYNSTTVKNCNIIQGGDTSYSHAIYIRNSYFANITNNTISTFDSPSNGIKHAIYLYSTKFSTIFVNKINTNRDNSYGIYLYSNSNDNTISNNTITAFGTYNYGIYVRSSDSNTISNNIIKTIRGTNSWWSYGIYIYSSTNLTVTNNEMNTTNGYAIFIEPTTNVSYYNHTIDTSNTEQDEPIYYYFAESSLIIENLDNFGQIYITNSTNVTIRNVTTDKDGIILAITTNSTVSNSNVTTDNFYEYGIYLYSSSNSNLISNNTITTFDSSGYGIYLSSSNSNTLKNNTIKTSGQTSAHGIYLTSSNSNLIVDNNITTTDSNGYGIRISYSDLNNIVNNTIKTSGSGSYGIYLYSSSDYNTLFNNIIKTTSTSSAHGIYIYSSNSNNITNANITISGGSSKDIYIRGTNNYINYIINSTFNQSNVGFYSSSETDKIAIQWYLRANITDTGQNPISSATVTAYNISNISVASDTTSSSGLTNWFILTEYIQNASQIYPINVTYHTPHNITVYRSGYTPDFNSTLVNLTETGSTTVHLTLGNGDGSCNPPSSGNWDIYDTRTCENITITMNGNLTIYNGGNLTFRNVSLLINNTFDGEYGIEVKSGGNMSIYDIDNNKDSSNDASNITAIDTNYEYFFWIDSGSKFEMKNSYLSECGWTQGSSPYKSAGLWINTDNTTIVNNTITSEYYGIHLRYSGNHTIIGNTLYNNKFSIILFSSSDNFINENNVNSTTNPALYLDHSHRNLVIQNNLTGSQDASYSCGIFSTGSYNNTFIENNIESINRNAIIFDGVTAEFINSTLRSAENYYDIRFCYFGACNGKITLINTTFNKSKVYHNPAGTSLLIVKWYLDVYVNDTSGSPVNQANVTAWMNNGTKIFSELTAPTGYI
ncbi:MAG: hypothetical protein DRP11_03815, partial [Candidatus Aenigmatarchaeota archaeon]